MDLAQKKCVPCSVGTAPLKGQALKMYADALGAGWTVVNEHHLEREFSFKNFRNALDFVNQVGKIAGKKGIIPTSI